MFLEIKGIEKYYGTGENRTKVLSVCFKSSC